MQAVRSTREQVAFFLLFAILGALAFWLVRAYLDLFAFSMVVVIVLKPLYDKVLGWVRGRKTIATILTIIAFFVAIVIPLWISVDIISNQLSTMSGQMQSSAPVPTLEQLHLPPVVQEQVKGVGRDVAVR